jgi:XisI protein
MDKSTEHIKILKEIFDEYQSLMKRASSNIDQKVSPIFIVDELQGIFAWLDFGWTKQGRTKSINVFVRLKDGKIHIEEDWTEEGIGTILLERGVSPKDIVIEFHPPEMRQYTEFAIS